MTRFLLLVLILSFSTALEARAQLPVFRVWPDTTPPCNGTLQACVNAASADDAIDVVTNGPIDESITLSRSIELTASPGFQPVFAAGRNIVASPLNGGSHFFLIQGMTLASGGISVENTVAGAITAWVRNNRCDGIFLSAETGFPLSFRIVGNHVTPVFGQPRGIGVQTGPAYGTGEISGNDVAMYPDNGAIGIGVEGPLGSMSVDVVANRVTGLAYGSGIRMQGAAFYQAHIVNNLVTGANANGYGIIVAGNGTTTNFSIVNNTVTENDFGIVVDFANAQVANNAVTGHTATGLAVSNSNTVGNGNNLFFGNGNDFLGTVPGPNTLYADPLYTDAQAFRPTSYSPVVDAGDDTLVPAAITTDLDGNPRIDGTVDIGAYEVPEPSAISATGAALLSLVSRAVSRRRRADGLEKRRLTPESPGT